jgi:hypothetical protein
VPIGNCSQIALNLSMDFSGLLTFLGLLIAAYSIMPEHSRLSIRVFISSWVWFLGILLLCLCTFLIYVSRKIHVDGLKYKDGSYFGAVDIELIIFLLISVYTVFIIFKISKAKITHSNIKSYRDLIEELSLQKEYQLLAKSLGGNLERLIMFSNERTFVQRKLDSLLNFLRPNDLSSHELHFGALSTKIKFILADLTNDSEEKVGQPSFIKRQYLFLTEDIPKRLYIWFYRNIKFLFFGKQVSQYASEILGKFVYQRDFAKYLVSNNPKLAINILNNDSHSREQSPHSIVEAFIEDTETIFYTEVYKASNEGVSEETPLMQAILGDIEKAEKLNIYRPIGEYNIQYLKELKRTDTDELQFEYDVRFSEFLKLKNPIYAGIFFYDTLIRSALNKGVQWHMWLYYLSYWVKGIVENANSEYWQTRTEFPNRYAYLLYELISTQKYWIVDFMGKDKIKVEDLNDHENGNIFKCICDSLAQSTAAILGSKDIPDRFQMYIADMIWNLVLMLQNSQSEDEKRLGEYLLLSIKRNFRLTAYTLSNTSIYNAYNNALDRVDWHRYPHELYKSLQSDWSTFDPLNAPY